MRWRWLVAGCMMVSPCAQATTPVASAQEERFAGAARDLVSRMTLEEKAAQVKHDAPAIPRLGIPAYNWWSEGLHGVARAGEATVFPQAIALAATWDAPLAQTVGDVVATEFRAKYRAETGPDGASKQYRGLTVWSPNINIFRDPRWGRGQETFGEDPYLTGRFGVAYVRGLQGDDPLFYKTMAVAKHFAVHSGPEAGRHHDDIHPSAHDLEDTYLPAFRTVVTQAHPSGIMCAYNAIDGTPACASPLLEQRLRRDWGLSGHIVSDCAAIADFFRPGGHAWSPTPEQAVASAIRAGTDMICAEFGNNQSADPAIIVHAVRQGLLPERDLDRAVIRMMEGRLRLGLIRSLGSNPYAAIGVDQNDTPGHAALNLRVARESLVLLKNDGLLPLKRDPASIAVIGPNANSVDALVGNYNGTPAHPVTVVAGLRARFPHAAISFVEGTGVVSAPLKDVPDAALCQDAACTMRGLVMEEFAGDALAGAPVARTVSANARFGWGRPLRVDRNSSIRWTGYLRAAETGPYRFHFESENGYRVLIGGKPVVAAWDAADPAAIEDGEITLEAGKLYPITIEARQQGNRGAQKLMWSNFAEREEAALAAASKAELVVFASGLNSRVEGEEMRVHADGFAGGDRTSLDLPAPQQRLLERLHALGKPLVLVNMSGSAMALNWADQHVPAIIQGWYPGGEGGRAIAELIAGDFSPSGRLPVTFYQSAGQLPAFGDYAMAGRTYRYFGGRALYPFGHALSFTRFAYGAPHSALARVTAGRGLDVWATVTNTGQRDSDEVVQVYVSRPLNGAPIRSLAGFARVHLRHGGSRKVRFTLAPDAFSIVDNQGRRRVPTGQAGVWIGGGQPGADVTPMTITIVTGKMRLHGKLSH